MNTKFYYLTTLFLAFSTSSYADINSEILSYLQESESSIAIEKNKSLEESQRIAEIEKNKSLEESDGTITKHEDSSLEESDIYNKTKAHFWAKPFISNYYVRNDAKEELDYSFSNYGSIFALDFKPTDESLVGVAFTGGMGNITVKKVNLGAINIDNMNSKIYLNVQGISAFAGFRTPLGIRVDTVFSGFKINAKTKDDNLKAILTGIQVTDNNINLSSFDSKIKFILDLVPNKKISFHPYVGLGYGTMTSTELSAANSGNDNIYDTTSFMLGLDVWGYYKVNTTKLYPNLFVNYEIPLNRKKSDPSSIASKFNFGNKFNVGGSLYLEFIDTIDLEIGYNFELNDKLKGNNYFLKLKFDL